MRLTPPKQSTYWIAVILAVLGLIAFILSYFMLPILALIGFILVLLAFILLVLGLLVKGF